MRPVVFFARLVEAVSRYHEANPHQALVKNLVSAGTILRTISHYEVIENPAFEPIIRRRLRERAIGLDQTSSLGLLVNRRNQ